MPNTQPNTVSQSGVTLSGLLNVLDGFYAPTGVLFVMTTNDLEKLDEALLRPGRIDYKLFLGKASNYQKAELYRRFFPKSSEDEAQEFVEASRSMETMAEFQGMLLALEEKGHSDFTSKSRKSSGEESPLLKTKAARDHAVAGS